MSDNKIMAQGIRSYLAGVDRNTTEDDISVVSDRLTTPEN